MNEQNGRGPLPPSRERHLFLDPDTGFYERSTGGSGKIVLVSELAEMLATKEAVIVYRHQYWPKPKLDNVVREAYPYVEHGLRMLRNPGLCSFAYQSQAASFFFVAAKQSELEPLEAGLRHAMVGLPSEVVNLTSALSRVEC